MKKYEEKGVANNLMYVSSSFSWFCSDLLLNFFFDKEYEEEECDEEEEEEENWQSQFNQESFKKKQYEEKVNIYYLELTSTI